MWHKLYAGLGSLAINDAPPVVSCPAFNSSLGLLLRGEHGPLPAIPRPIPKLSQEPDVRPHHFVHRGKGGAALAETRIQGAERLTAAQ